MDAQKRFVITGGTGLVGQALVEKIQVDYPKSEVIILTRSKREQHGLISYVQYEPSKHKIVGSFSPTNKDVIIHLAGAGIADQSWSQSRKKVLIESRIDPIRTLFKFYDVAQVKPQCVVTASGVNCYPVNTENRMREENAYGDDFLSDIVRKWEEEVRNFERITRVVYLRIGMVLSKEGGALERLKKITRKNIAAPLGNGTQKMPFVHLDDLCNAFLFAVQNPHLEGAYNCIADEVPSNKEFMKKLGQVMQKKVWSMHVPKLVLKLGLGKMSEMLLTGVNTTNQKIKEEGFSFQYASLDKALKATC